MKVIEITDDKGYWDGQKKHKRGSVISVTSKTAEQLFRQKLARPEPQTFKAQKVKRPTVKTTETWPKNTQAEKKEEPKKTTRKHTK